MLGIALGFFLIQLFFNWDSVLKGFEDGYKAGYEAGSKIK